MADAAAIHLEMFEALVERDFDRMREMYHPDYEYTDSEGTTGGIEVGLAVGQTYTAAFPDMAMAINHHTTCGDTSVIELTATGTHQGELQGIPPTGKSVEVRVCNIVEVRDGQVYRERDYFNALSLMQQLGVIPTE